jgi:DNA-binding protein YbaB
MLEDLVVAAVNDAGRRAEDAMQANAKSLLGGLNIPGLG